MDKVEIVRGLVRPIVTYLVVLALAGVMVYLVIKFADLELTKIVLAAFLGMVGPILGFWFASRTANKTTTPSQ